MFHKLLIAIFSLVLAIPVVAQETPAPECDPVALATEYSTRISPATTLEELKSINIQLRDAIRNCEQAPIGLSRDNPLPLNSEIIYEMGKVTFISVEEISVADSSNYQLGENEKLIAISMTFLCEREDINATCSKNDAGGWVEYITADGIVLDQASYYPSDMMRTGDEAYSGATLEGRVYFAVPSTEPLGMLRAEYDQTWFIDLED